MPMVSVLGMRVIAAGLAGTMGGLHVYLWDYGYRDVDTIGTLFLLNGIGAGLLMVALPVTPIRWLAALSTLGALFTAGTLAALVISIERELFDFHESWEAPLARTTAAVESAGTLSLIILAVVAGVLGKTTTRVPIDRS